MERAVASELVVEMQRATTDGRSVFHTITAEDLASALAWLHTRNEALDPYPSYGRRIQRLEESADWRLILSTAATWRYSSPGFFN